MGAETQIKPCPFCGSHDVGFDGVSWDDHFVQCEACFAWGPTKDNEADAVEAWNRRVDAPQEVRHGDQ